MRENEFISIRSITSKGTKEVSVEREKLLKVMKDLKEIFIDNNEISKKFVEMIPVLEEIEINEVRNQDCDTPFVVCNLKNGDFKTIYISRKHTIVWGILNEFIK